MEVLACWERNRELMEREAWRLNVPHHCSFHGSWVRLLGHLRPITWETCYWVSFALWASRFFSLNGFCLKWLPNSIGGLQKSPPLSSSLLFVFFIRLWWYQRLSVMLARVGKVSATPGSAGQEVMRRIIWKREREGNGHKESWEGLWRISTLFWCFAIYVETGWMEKWRQSSLAGLIGCSLNEPNRS